MEIERLKMHKQVLLEDIEVRNTHTQNSVCYIYCIYCVVLNVVVMCGCTLRFAY